MSFSNFEFGKISWADDELFSKLSSHLEGNINHQIEQIKQQQKVITPADVFSAMLKGNLIKLISYIKCGYDVNSSHNGQTALHYACSRVSLTKANFLYTINILLAAGANPLTQTEHEKYTALHVLAKSNNKQSWIAGALELLLDNKADLNALDAQGNTALTLATMLQNKDFVRAIYEAEYEEIEVALSNNDGKTPLWYIINSVFNDHLNQNNNILDGSEDDDEDNLDFIFAISIYLIDAGATMPNDVAFTKIPIYYLLSLYAELKQANKIEDFNDFTLIFDEALLKDSKNILSEDFLDAAAQHIQNNNAASLQLLGQEFAELTVEQAKFLCSQGLGLFFPEEGNKLAKYVI